MNISKCDTGLGVSNGENSQEKDEVANKEGKENTRQPEKLNMDRMVRFYFSN